MCLSVSLALPRGKKKKSDFLEIQYFVSSNLTTVFLGTYWIKHLLSDYSLFFLSGPDLMLCPQSGSPLRVAPAGRDLT